MQAYFTGAMDHDSACLWTEALSPSFSRLLCSTIILLLLLYHYDHEVSNLQPFHRWAHIGILWLFSVIISGEGHDDKCPHDRTMLLLTAHLFVCVCPRIANATDEIGGVNIWLPFGAASVFSSMVWPFTGNVTCRVRVLTVSFCSVWEGTHELWEKLIWMCLHA